VREQLAPPHVHLQVGLLVEGLVAKVAKERGRLAALVPQVSSQVRRVLVLLSAGGAVKCGTNAFEFNVGVQAPLGGVLASTLCTSKSSTL
jgi:hypothetical protein